MLQKRLLFFKHKALLLVETRRFRTTALRSRRMWLQARGGAIPQPPPLDGFGEPSYKCTRSSQIPHTFSAALAAIGILFSTIGVASAQDAFELRDGDRVVLLGGTFIERMQSYGYVETALTVAHAKSDIVFRNLGWSGDDVTGIARALFGSQEDGFKRLIADVEHAKPTMILVAYGGNEAHAGASGIEPFETGLNRLLDALKKTEARIVLIATPRHENLGPPLPNPAEYNESLGLYRDVLAAVARDRGAGFVDLYDLTTTTPDKPAERLTDNSLHLTGYGYWRAAQRLLTELDAVVPPWQVDVEATDPSYDAVGTSLAMYSTTERGVRFTATDDALPLPPPAHSPAAGMDSPRDQRILRVRGLAAGNYDLLIDGHKVLTSDHRQFAAGIDLRSGPQFAQAERLRRAIGQKNELYFHRYRPQNETYLFLFRKHEQGNNAVEIPQFDPLVEEKEKEIATLRKPLQHVYEIRRAGRE